MSPEGVVAAKRRIELQLVDAGKVFRHQCAQTLGDFSKRGMHQSSSLILTVHSHCEDELLLRANTAWKAVRTVIDSEGYIPGDKNRAQIREILEKAVGKGSTDIDGEYERVCKFLTGKWPDLVAARNHAVESALADAEIDLLGREARRPPLEDELSPPRYAPVREHWRKAMDTAKEQPPNLPNAVKETAHAVESLVQVVLGKPGLTLGESIKELRAQKRLPVGADKVFEGLYAFANSSPGARHGSALPAHVDEHHWEFVRTTAEGAMRLLLDIDAP